MRRSSNTHSEVIWETPCNFSLVALARLVDAMQKTSPSRGRMLLGVLGVLLFFLSLAQAPRVRLAADEPSAIRLQAARAWAGSIRPLGLFVPADAPPTCLNLEDVSIGQVTPSNADKSVAVGNLSRAKYARPVVPDQVHGDHGAKRDCLWKL